MLHDLFLAIISFSLLSAWESESFSSRSGKQTWYFPCLLEGCLLVYRTEDKSSRLHGYSLVVASEVSGASGPNDFHHVRLQIYDSNPSVGSLCRNGGERRSTLSAC